MIVQLNKLVANKDLRQVALKTVLAGLAKISTQRLGQSEDATWALFFKAQVKIATGTAQADFYKEIIELNKNSRGGNNITLAMIKSLEEKFEAYCETNGYEEVKAARADVGLGKF